MRVLNSEESSKVLGGNVVYTAAFIGAICKVVDLLFNIGESIGSAIRRSTDHDICPIK